MGQMGEAELLTYQGQVLASWKSPKQSYRLDSKRLELEHPELIPQYQIGAVWTEDSPQSIEEAAKSVIELSSKSGIKQHCQQVGAQWFSAPKAAAQITQTFSTANTA